MHLVIAIKLAKVLAIPDVLDLVKVDVVQHVQEVVLVVKELAVVHVQEPAKVDVEELVQTHVM